MRGHHDGQRPGGDDNNRGGGQGRRAIAPTGRSFSPTWPRMLKQVRRGPYSGGKPLVLWPRRAIPLLLCGALLLLLGGVLPLPLEFGCALSLLHRSALLLLL